MKRAIIIVLDGVGIGHLPDANNYGDVGANTIVNVADKVGGLSLPNMKELGLGNIANIKGVEPVLSPQAAYGKMAEKSKGKDSTTGHWEIAGLDVKIDFPTFPNGFSDEIIDKFVSLTNVPGVLLNKPYSGTDAIEEFGQEHLESKKPIVYTSADSVFQIACHEEVYPIEQLYKMCELARFQIFAESPSIGRVIARPFLGNAKDGFYRTENRKDYSISPPEKTLLDLFKDNNLESVGIGKIEDLFDFQGLTQSFHSKLNSEGIDATIKYLQTIDKGLIFTNLVEFDSKWGHRNNYHDFAKGLEYFDQRLPEILNALTDDDILILTADHGCDPTFPGTDHTREYIPLIAYGKKIKPTNLAIRDSFADIAQTIADLFKLDNNLSGTSFLNLIK